MKPIAIQIVYLKRAKQIYHSDTKIYLELELNEEAIKVVTQIVRDATGKSAATCPFSQ